MDNTAKNVILSTQMFDKGDKMFLKDIRRRLTEYLPLGKLTLRRSTHSKCDTCNTPLQYYREPCDICNKNVKRREAN